VDRVRSWVPLLGWLGSLAAGIVLFTALGDGQLAAPALGDPSSWGDWAADRDPIVAAVAVLRLVVLALAWYLVGVTTIGLVARLTRAARLVRLADALSLPFVRQLLQGALGLTLAAGVVASASGAAPGAAGRGPDPAPATASAVALPDDDAGDRGDGAVPTMVVVGADETGGDGPRMVVIADDGAPASMVAVDGPATARMVGLGPPGAAAAEDPAAVADPAPAPAAAEHEVAAGEHLWSIAADHLEGHLGRVPSDDEVVDHWQRLIELNRDRLANPDDPDLVFPGQRFVLPDLPDQAGT
jgi:hypothetical protein